MNDTLLMVFAVFILGFILGFPLFMLAWYWIKNHSDFKVLGMEFLCKPRTIKDKLDRGQIEMIILAYVRHMFQVFDTTEKQLLNVLSRVHVEIHEGYLSNDIRVRAGLGDSDDNGIRDKITGLTLIPRDIIIGIVQAGETYDISKTAFMYELHNIAINSFLGYNVMIAESFINPKNTIYQKILNTNEAGLIKLKAQRKIYDDAFKSIKV